MQPFRPGVRRKRLILALLTVLTLETGFLLQPFPVQAELFHLAPPPGRSPGSPLLDWIANSQAQADSSILHLPIVLTPPGAQLSDSRQATLDLYRQEYLSYIQTPIEWTGDHAACDPGTTSAAYRPAILRRVNYFRQMAGVPAAVVFSVGGHTVKMDRLRQLFIDPGFSGVETFIASGNVGFETADTDLPAMARRADIFDCPKSGRLSIKLKR